MRIRVRNRSDWNSKVIIHGDWGEFFSSLWMDEWRSRSFVINRTFWLPRHGWWTIAMKIQGFLTVAIPTNQFHWTNWQVTSSLSLSLAIPPISLSICFFIVTLVVSFAELGVLYWKLNPTIYENDEELTTIREARGYNYMVLFYFILFYFISVCLILFSAIQ